MPTKDELREAIETADELAKLASMSAAKTNGPYKKPTLENIERVREVLAEVSEE